MKVLITGARGFVGRAIVARIAELPHLEYIGASRKKSDSYALSPELGRNADWTPLLKDVDVVVHAAARAHVLNEVSSNPSDVFRETNVDGSLVLARQAVKAGVRRFIFLSSIGVNGKKSSFPFTEKDVPAPCGDYAHSKYEAEQQLLSLGNETGLEVVIIRPPLVYGPNAPGNFGILTKVVAKRIPLPLGGINNQRSFVSVWNLANLIATCIDHPSAAGQIFLVSDGEDVSISDFLKKIGEASGYPVRQFWVPSYFEIQR